jgi:hypothetical protein
VLDGGWLLHRLSWTKQDSYIDLFSKYSDYVIKCYGKEAVVVFDGYNGPSTKYMAHQKRTKAVGREILFTNDMKINFTKEEFLSNQDNKQKFLKELGKIVVKHADGDADFKIITTALECAINKNVAVVSEDTDLLILLIHYCKEFNHNMYMKSESKSKKCGKTWNIKKIQDSLGKELCSSILFCHAFLGCDTTSKPFWKRKSTTLKLQNTNSDFKILSKVFYDSDSTKQNIDSAEENVMCIIYEGLVIHGIDSLRYKILKKGI